MALDPGCQFDKVPVPFRKKEKRSNELGHDVDPSRMLLFPQDAKLLAHVASVERAMGDRAFYTV